MPTPHIYTIVDEYTVIAVAWLCMQGKACESQSDRGADGQLSLSLTAWPALAQVIVITAGTAEAGEIPVTTKTGSDYQTTISQVRLVHTVRRRT